MAAREPGGTGLARPGIVKVADFELLEFSQSIGQSGAIEKRRDSSRWAIRVIPSARGECIRRHRLPTGEVGTDFEDNRLIRLPVDSDAELS